MTGYSHVGTALEQAIESARDDGERSALEAIQGSARRVADHRAKNGGAWERESDRAEQTERDALARAVLAPLPAFCKRSREEMEPRVVPALLALSRAVPRRSALICGPSAAGKTTAVALAFRSALYEGVAKGGPAWHFARRMVWERAFELACHRGEHVLGAGEPPRVDRCRRASLVVLDDIGKEPPNLSIHLWQVVNLLYEAEIPMLVTTGLTPAELDARYDANFVRRALEGGQIVDVFPKE